MIEDSDYSLCLYADIVDPSAAFSTTVYKVALIFLRKRGIADPFFGRQVHKLMEQIEFVNISHDGWTRMYRGRETDIRILSETFQATSRRMIAAGLLSQEQLNNFMNFFINPTFNLIGPIMFSAWGKRPL